MEFGFNRVKIWFQQSTVH